MATDINSHIRRPGPFPKGRVCANPECSTLLSTYHDSDECYVCEPRPALNGLAMLDSYRVLELAEAA